MELSVQEYQYLVSEITRETGAKRDGSGKNLMTKDEYPSKIGEIEDILYDAMLNAKYSEVNIIYNH